MTEQTTPREHPPRRDVVLLSGGIASATALARSRALGHDTLALTIDYGQPNRRTVRAARDIAARLDSSWQIVEMLDWGTLATPDGAKPPNLHATLVMVAASLADRLGFNRVVTGSRLPAALLDGPTTALVECGTGHAVTLAAPFADTPAYSVLTQAANLDVPLDLTWSCHTPADTHCGWCPGCSERSDAFRAAAHAQAKLTDPTEYTRPAATR